MKANIHTPHRLEGESFAVYKQRRELSQRAAKSARVVVGGYQQNFNAEANQRREDTKRVGIRQLKKVRRELRGWI